MKSIPVVVFLLSTFFIQPFLPQKPIIYTVSPAEKGQLAVEIEFDGHPSGRSFLNYEDDQYGEKGQQQRLVFLEQKGAVSITAEPDSNRFRIDHDPKMTRVAVRFALADWQKTGEPFHEYCCQKAVIRDDHFHVLANRLLPQPDHYFSGPTARAEVEFFWRGFPENWLLHTSFGPDRHQKARLTSTELGSASFLGGDFRRSEFTIRGQKAYFLTRGKWLSFSDDELKTLMGQILEGHRAFWNDFSDSIYTVSFVPVDTLERGLSYGGEGLTNSFMSYAMNSSHLRLDYMRYLFMHELMHHWIGNWIENADEERQYWFSEGFTEYFTLKNSLKYGFIDVAGFIKELNDGFATPHSRSPVRTMPNDSLNYERFWSGDKNWEKLPYQRGCLFAFWLDGEIRKTSKGSKNLDAIMREILADCKKDPSLKLSNAYFLTKIKPVLGRKGQRAFKKYIERGQPINFKKAALPDGLEAEIKDVKMSFGSGPTKIDRTETWKNVLVFRKKDGANEAAVREAILR